MDRRSVLGAGLALMLTGLAEAQTSGGALSENMVFHFDKLKAKPSSNGGESRAVVEGNLTTGEHVEVHMSALPPGKMPHPPHRHKNSEFILIREGEIDYLTDGRTERVGPGDIIFNASMKPHGMKNVGTSMARYFVVSVGEKADSQEVTLVPAKG